MFSPLLKLMELPKLKGHYEGVLENRYTEPDGTVVQQRRFLKLHIVHNLNGFWVKAQFFQHKSASSPTSVSVNTTHSIEKLPDGTFRIEYHFKSDPNLLNNIQQANQAKVFYGFCSFIFSPDNQTLTGYSYSDPRHQLSFSNLKLNPVTHA